MKRASVIVLSLIMVLSVFMGVSAKDASELNVWSIVPKGSGIFWNNMQIGVNDYCSEAGIETVTLTAPDETANVQQQIELCEAAVSSGADVLIFRPSDPEAFMDVVVRAVNNGMTVFAFQDAPHGGLEEYIPGWTGISPEMLGESQAQAVISGVEAGNIAEDATVFYLSPTLTNPTHIANCDSFVATLSAAYPNMTILTDETGSGQGPTVAAELVDAYMLSNPEISVLVANGSNETAVMAAKVEGDGKEDKIWVVGCDGGEDQAEMLYIGTLDVTVLQDTYGVGYAAAKIAVDIEQNGITPDFYTPIGCNLLFPEGVADYCEENGWDMTAWNSYEG